MSEKVPQQPQAPAQESQEGEEIPLFAKLEKKSQEFVLEVKRLTETTDEDFILRYPLLAEIRTEAEAKEKGPWEPTLREHEFKGRLKAVFARALGKYVPKSFRLGDNQHNIGTMWDMVRLHLLELEDSIKHPGMSSRQTDYLAERMLRNIIKNEAWAVEPRLPDDIGHEFTYYIRGSQPWPETTAGKLILITRLLNAVHLTVGDDKKGPAGFNLLGDLWKYIIIRVDNPRNIDLRAWNKHAGDFFERLSDIRLATVPGPESEK